MGLYVARDSFTDATHTKSRAQISTDSYQTHAPWNLQAISTRVPVGDTDAKAMKYTYTFARPIGADVDIYVVDSGVYLPHDEFQGRARFGWAVPGYTDEDDKGHGTHIAGIAAGYVYGVAKRANIVSVQVVDKNNEGTAAEAIEALNWIGGDVRSTPSVACMAFGRSYHRALNEAAETLVARGVTVVVSAGNNNEDAATRSPASARNVITVGASNIMNQREPQSNFGAVVDVFAPGVTITAAWTGAPHLLGWGSGTSQACAHVAGIAAYLLSRDRNMTPAAVKTRIKSLATPNVIGNVPDGTTNLAFNGGFPPPP